MQERIFPKPTCQNSRPFSGTTTSWALPRFWNYGLRLCHLRSKAASINLGIGLRVFLSLEHGLPTLCRSQRAENFTLGLLRRTPGGTSTADGFRTMLWNA